MCRPWQSLANHHIGTAEHGPVTVWAPQIDNQAPRSNRGAFSAWACHLDQPTGPQCGRLALGELDPPEPLTARDWPKG